MRLVREWEIGNPSGTVTLGEACARFLSDAEARKLREGSIAGITAEAARNSAITLKVLRRIGMDRNESRRGREGS